MNQIQKHRQPLWIKAYSGLTNAKWKTVLCSDESKHEISFGNDGHCVLCAEEEGETV